MALEPGREMQTTPKSPKIPSISSSAQTPGAENDCRRSSPHRRNTAGAAESPCRAAPISLSTYGHAQYHTILLRIWKPKTGQKPENGTQDCHSMKSSRPLPTGDQDSSAMREQNETLEQKGSMTMYTCSCLSACQDTDLEHNIEDNGHNCWVLEVSLLGI